MNVYIANNQQTAFCGVTVFKQIRELFRKECLSKFIPPVRGWTVEADELQIVSMKVDRPVQKFKGRTLKWKVSGSGEVRTQRLAVTKVMPPLQEERGQEMVWYPGGARLAHLALSPLGCSHDSVIQKMSTLWSRMKLLMAECFSG